MTMITHLGPHEVFVFGSNEAGIHGAGAAKQALQWGAKRGVGYGLQGKTFAIPTKDYRIQTLPLPKIHAYVDRFRLFALIYPNLTFLVTAIGCGLAGYKPEQIAPMFANPMPNVVLPEEFK